MSDEFKPSEEPTEIVSEEDLPLANARWNVTFFKHLLVGAYTTIKEITVFDPYDDESGIKL